MSTVAIARALATRMRLAATSRTWLTPPAEPSTASLAMVCTESTTSRSGETDSTCPRTVARSVSAASSRRGRSAPIRSARMRTWAADSSPVTYSTRCPCDAARDATSRSSVDLPTPGSPASSTAAPPTRPPPSTRSSSSTPVGRTAAGVASTSAMGWAGTATARAA